MQLRVGRTTPVCSAVVAPGGGFWKTVDDCLWARKTGSGSSWRTGPEDSKLTPSSSTSCSGARAARTFSGTLRKRRVHNGRRARRARIGGRAGRGVEGGARTITSSNRSPSRTEALASRQSAGGSQIETASGDTATHGAGATVDYRPTGHAATLREIGPDTDGQSRRVLP